jgi:uncharacterized protein YbaP (TraB family)
MYDQERDLGLRSFNVRSGTGDLRKVLDGGARKNNRKTMVAAIAISRNSRMKDHERAHALRRLFMAVGTC